MAPGQAGGARLLAGPTPRHPFANAIVDVAVSAITVTVVWRLTDTAVRRDRIAVGALGVIGFFVLTFGPGHVDAAAAVVPAAWFGAALFAGRA